MNVPRLAWTQGHTYFDPWNLKSADFFVYSLHSTLEITLFSFVKTPVEVVFYEKVLSKTYQKLKLFKATTIIVTSIKLRNSRNRIDKVRLIAWDTVLTTTIRKVIQKNQGASSFKGVFNHFVTQTMDEIIYLRLTQYLFTFEKEQPKVMVRFFLNLESIFKIIYSDF